MPAGDKPPFLLSDVERCVCAAHNVLYVERVVTDLVNKKKTDGLSIDHKIYKYGIIIKYYVL